MDAGHAVLLGFVVEATRPHLAIRRRHAPELPLCSLDNAGRVGQSALVAADWVYVSAWRLQCCGEPFQTGSIVEWTTSSLDDEYLSSLLPHDVADRVTRWEEHHADPDVQLDVVRGTVESIDAVFCTLERLPGTRALTPLPGSGVLDHRETADGWEEEDQLYFCGYIVAVNAESS